MTQKNRLRDAVKLGDDEMEKVSGGYVETKGYATGHEIRCPKCGNEDESLFETWIERNEGEKDHFRCKNCGYAFTVDASGNYDAA